MDEIIKTLEADAEEAWQRYEDEEDELTTKFYEEGFSDGVMHAVRKFREALVEANLIENK